MKNAPLFIVLALIVFCSGCRRESETRTPASAPPADTRIVGSWASSGGDYALVNEYRADGTVVQKVGSRQTEPSPYRIEGDILITSLKQPDGSVSEDKERFTLSGDTLTFHDEDGTQRIFRRRK